MKQAVRSFMALPVPPAAFLKRWLGGLCVGEVILHTWVLFPQVRCPVFVLAEVSPNLS